MPPLYPIFVNLDRAPVLIIGGGTVALRKARSLLDASAHITIVSPEFDPAFAELTAITRCTQMYDAAILAERPWRLVFAATNNTQINEQIARDARAHNLLCCRCDDGSSGDFVGGATRGDAHVRIAVSSHGASPALAARIADQALQGVDPLLLQWAQLLESWRPQVVAHLRGHARANLLKRIASTEMESILRTHGPSAAETAFHAWLKQHP